MKRFIEKVITVIDPHLKKENEHLRRSITDLSITYKEDIDTLTKKHNQQLEQLKEFYDRLYSMPDPTKEQQIKDRIEEIHTTIEKIEVEEKKKNLRQEKQNKWLNLSKGKSSVSK
jgi:excinuclease UvrABC helicase subunit UvrB